MNYMQNLIQLRENVRRQPVEVNMNKYIIAPLLFCCLAASAWADSVQLREDHPDRYVVVKGDTLWGISAKFLKDPWLWPRVWKMNRAQIKNPHLIYPGDVIALDMSGGEPRLMLLPETVKLEPGVRVEPLEKQAIPSIAPSVIAPFLSQPLVVEESDLKSAPKILGTIDSRTLIDTGTKVYADKLGSEDSLNWQIYRPGDKLIDPDTKQVLGTEAIYLGEAKITKPGDPATLLVTRATQDIEVKDRLIKPSDNTLNTFVPHAPDSAVRGRIISIYDGMSETGRNSIVAINRGAADGLEQGHVLAIYRDGATLPAEKQEGVQKEGYINLERNEDGSLKRDADGKVQVQLGSRRTDGGTDPSAVKLPDERLGLLMVFRTFEHVSYALIMQSDRPIKVPDIVVTP